MKQLASLFIVILLMTYWVSCDERTQFQKPGQTFLEKEGFRKETIEEKGDFLIIDGDVVISKTDLENHIANNTSLEKSLQVRTTFIVDQVKAKNIRVKIDPSLNSYPEWIDAIRQAISSWNTEFCSQLNFVEVNISPDITIYNDLSAPSSGYENYSSSPYSNLSSDICAMGSFPLNGLPGPIISINVDNIYTDNSAKRKRTATHELGHCIGFRHNDDYEAEFWANLHFGWVTIPGTPDQTDVASLMNAGECGTEKVLSYYDKIATAVMYPPGTCATINITYPTTPVIKSKNYVDVTWVASGSFSTAKLSYSVDNGPWTVIATGLSHSMGEYIWTGATQVSTNYRFLISDDNIATADPISTQFTIGPDVVINGPMSVSSSGQSANYSVTASPSYSYTYTWYKKIGSGSYSSIGSGSSKSVVILSPNTSIKVETRWNGSLVGETTKFVNVGLDP